MFRPLHFNDLYCLKVIHRGFTPVFNLKNLNRWVRSEHFKMESIQLAKSLVQEKDFMITIDLKDAYFMIPIHYADRKFLRFEWNEDLLEFQVLPFRLTTARNHSESL